jgi:hypothetical protein
MRSVERSLSVILSLAGAGVLFATGLYGGRLVFDHAAGVPTEVLQAELRERGTDHDHAAGEEHEAMTDSGTVKPGSAVVADSTVTPPHSHSPGTPAHTH